jgi:hypothetical protein
MNDMNRFAALWVCLLAIGGIATCGIHVATQPAPGARVEGWRNQRVIMQSLANPGRWEALEVMAHDPGQYVRTELTPAQARRWVAQGGFRQVSPQEYNARLAIAGDYARASALRAAAKAQGSTYARW